MIQITKAEADFLRKIDPEIFIAVTGRKKAARHKRRYVAEDIEVLRLLPGNSEAASIVEAYDRRQRYYKSRKKAVRRSV